MCSSTWRVLRNDLCALRKERLDRAWEGINMCRWKEGGFILGHVCKETIQDKQSGREV
uniref:Uncharacterized protein n=1 Tax=Triticum urartu TaxID=4572 RepID=A0A8R7U6K4_TRIUA